MPAPIFYTLHFSGSIGQIDSITVTGKGQIFGGHAPVIIPSTPPFFDPITDLASLMKVSIDLINDAGAMSNFLPGQYTADSFNLYDGSGVELDGAVVTVVTSGGLTCLNPVGVMSSGTSFGGGSFPPDFDKTTINNSQLDIEVKLALVNLLVTGNAGWIQNTKLTNFEKNLLFALLGLGDSEESRLLIEGSEINFELEKVLLEVLGLGL